MAERPSTPALDRAALLAAVAGLGLDLALDEATLAAFERYAATLVAWNARQNLTRLASPRDIAVAHLADSLACLGALPPALSGPGRALAVVDVGTGAGLPGLALALVRPEWRLTLVDAVGKKVAFVDHAIAELGLRRARALHARAEDLGRDAARRGTYDLALARAVAPLAVLAEYLLPLVRVGGRAVAMKGADLAAELAAAEPAARRLGAGPAVTLPYSLPGLAAARQLVVWEKMGPTPAAYPRRAGLPAREPLGR